VRDRHVTSTSPEDVGSGENAAPGSAPDTVMLPVTGMSCAACARTIEFTLKDVPGVRDASVNYATGRATVAFDPSVVTPPALVEAVRSVGYDVLYADWGHGGAEDGIDALPEELAIRTPSAAPRRRSTAPCG